MLKLEESLWKKYLTVRGLKEIIFELQKDLPKMGQVKITQVKSTIKRHKKQKATMYALGLRKMNRTVQHEASPQVEGMIAKVRHLVTVEYL